jgi:hypothetical protein
MKTRLPSRANGDGHAISNTSGFLERPIEVVTALCGLGLPRLIGWLQRREILHQEPVSEDIPAAHLAQKNPLDRIIQKLDVVPGRIVIAL